MNPPPSNQGRAGRRSGVPLLMVLLTYSLGAQTPAPRTNTPARPVDERFLLIVDTSAAMKKRAANVEQVVGKLFTSGLGEQLHPGDTIGVWTYTDDLHTGQFPLQRWTPQTSATIPLGIVDFLKSSSYEKTSRLTPVMAQLKSVVADSDKITVLLISDGGESITGTPYDEPIAEAYRANAADQRKQQMPFLTVLRAVKGKFIGFKVNTPPWPVEFPVFPAEPKPVAVATAVPEAKAEPPPDAPPQPKPELKVEAKPKPQIELPPVLPATNPAPDSNALRVSGVPAAETIPPVPPGLAPTSAPPPARVEARNPPPEIPAPVVSSKTNAANLGAKGKSLRPALLVVGAVLLSGIVGWVVFWLFWPHKQTRVSLITRSIDRDPK